MIRALSAIALGSCAFAPGAASISLASDSIETRLNRAAFPLARYSDRYEPVPRAVETELRKRVDQALDPIRIAPASWFRRSFGVVPSQGDRRRILESVREVEIWRCKEKSCSGCGGSDSGLGCVQAKRVSGGTGVVATIHPCLYGHGACPSGAKPNIDAWIERMVAGTAFHKSGLLDRNGSYKAAIAASSAWLAETSRSVNALLGACPGPYPVESMKFLLSTDSVTIPNPALKRCGEKYVAALRDLPTRCAALRGDLATEWDEFRKLHLAKDPDVVRADSYARKLLCRREDAVAIFTRFGDKATLLLTDLSCEGETAKDPTTFVRDALPPSLRSRLHTCL